MLKQDPLNDIEYIFYLIESGIPFTFVRFSDGEMEIIHNNYLEISEKVTKYRNIQISNSYPSHDYKYFDPSRDFLFRDELLLSAKYISDFYFKGIATHHNVDAGDTLISDQEILIGFNNRSLRNLTFSDLFLNSNFLIFRKKIKKVLKNISTGYVVANFQSKLNGPLTNFELLPVPNQAFQVFSNLLEEHLKILMKAPSKSLILSSASSYSNILGYHLHRIRPDLFFLDIGTSLNDFLGLPLNTRVYHCLLDRSIKGRISAFIYKRSPGYQLKW